MATASSSSEGTATAAAVDATGELISIDGSQGEGGGQILRNACALAVLLNRPLTISKIRAGRDKPGLRPQHLTAIELITAMAEGQLEGAAVNSTSLTLKPRELKPGQFVGDTRTAGSTCLLLQVSLPCALFAPGPCTLVFKGGTNASAAPQIDYAEHVFLPTVRRMGAEVSMRIVRRGYHPQGGGEVVVETQSLQGRGLQPLDLTDFGQIQSVQGLTFASAKLPAHIAERMAQTARKLLRKALPTSTPIEVEAVAERPERGIGAGCGITVVCRTSTGCLLGGSALGERGKSAETVAEAAVDELLATVNAGACVDEWLLDQLVIYAALAEGRSRFLAKELSLHATTAMAVAEQILGVEFRKTPAAGGKLVLVECNGVGFRGKK